MSEAAGFYFYDSQGVRRPGMNIPGPEGPSGPVGPEGPPGNFDPTAIQQDIASLEGSVQLLGGDLSAIQEVVDDVQEAQVVTNTNLDNLFGRMNGFDEWVAKGERLVKFYPTIALRDAIPMPSGSLCFVEETRSYYGSLFGVWTAIWEPPIQTVVQFDPVTSGGVSSSITFIKQNGRVDLIGSISNVPATFPHLVGTIPEGLRPRGAFKMIVGGSGIFNEAVRLISINTNGELWWINNSGVPTGTASGTQLYLSGINYLAELPAGIA